jgi:iron-sulfur cluster assembly protein
MEAETNYQVSVSAKAVEQIKLQLQKRGTPESYLRLGIKGGGCSGFSYVLQFEDAAPKVKDLVFEIGGVRIVVDSKSIIYLNGSILDWEQTLMNQGYKFINPQEKSKCGCGTSFTV